MERRVENQPCLHSPAVRLAGDPHPVYVVRDTLLDENRLPYARQRAIPALFPEGNFSERRIWKLIGVIGRALDLHLDLVLAFSELFRDVKGERQKPAFMLSEKGPFT